MRRFMVVWILFALLLLGLSVVRANEGAEVSGLVTATDQEADEGYFGVGPDTMIVAKQGSELQAWMKRHLGDRIRVSLDQVEKAAK